MSLVQKQKGDNKTIMNWQHKLCLLFLLKMYIHCSKHIDVIIDLNKDGSVLKIKQCCNLSSEGMDQRD